MNEKNKTSVLRKMYADIPWFLSRLLQETENGTSQIGRILKPPMMMLYALILYPLNKGKAISLQNTSDTLYLFYDLEVSPVTFDFAWALAFAEQQRKRRNLKKIHVVFVPGKHDGLRKESPDYDQYVDLYARQWRCIEILRVMCSLISTCSGMTCCSTRREAFVLCEQQRPNILPNRYTTTFPIAQSTSHLLRSSGEVMVLQASLQAKRYIQKWLDKHRVNRKLITITFRCSPYMPARNSNISEWMMFAKTLDLKEYFPVFVPDTDNAFNPLGAEWDNFVIFNEPAWNLQLRAALYELSYLNLGVNNGVMILCWLNPKCRYITFKMMVPEVPQTTMEAFVRQGFKIGQSLPFANSLQKWVWENDDAIIIENEFKLMCQQINKHLELTAIF